MTYAPTQRRSDDWLTIDRAAIENALPIELLDKAIDDGDVPASVACGARVVRRYEAQAWALLVKAQAREHAVCEG